MSRTSVLLDALTDQPVSTSELYDRVGYLGLARVNLIPYPAFRAALEKLSAAGLVTGETASDGSTLWRLCPGSR